HPWISYPDLSYRLKVGDIVHLDPAGHYEHYWADVGRSAFVGEPTAKFDEFYAILQEVHHVADPLLQPGNSTAIPKKAAQQVASERLGKSFSAFIHSIGIEQYDHPQTLGEFLSEDFELEENMTVNFETLYFELGWGLLQLEDTYLVRE